MTKLVLIICVALTAIAFSFSQAMGAGATHTRLSKTEKTPLGGIINIQVNCPSSMHVTGGGFIDPDSGSNTTTFISAPLGNGWHLVVQGSLNKHYTDYVLCSS